MIKVGNQSASSSKSFANWTCSPSEPANFEPKLSKSKPFLVYFLPILGGQKTAMSNSTEGWCAVPGLFPAHYPLFYVLFPSHSWWAESCNVRLSKGMVLLLLPVQLLQLFLNLVH